MTLSIKVSSYVFILAATKKKAVKKEMINKISYYKKENYSIPFYRYNGTRLLEQLYLENPFWVINTLFVRLLLSLKI